MGISFFSIQDYAKLESPDMLFKGNSLVVLKNGKLSVKGFWGRLVRYFSTWPDTRSKQNKATFDNFFKTIQKESGCKLPRDLYDPLQKRCRDGNPLRLREVHAVVLHLQSQHADPMGVSDDYAINYNATDSFKL